MSVALEQFRRINPYPGLMVDVDVWRDAHDYHRAQLHLHHLALHGWGIVHGLDVTLVDGSPNTLHIASGLAIDPAGNFVNVPQSQNYQITAKTAEQVYIVLQLRELLTEPAPPSETNRSSPHTRVVEAYRIQERDRLPEEPYIELARVDFVPGRAAVRLPGNPESPGQNELDLRARVRLGTLAAPVHAPPVQIADGSTNGAAELAPRIDSLGDQVRGLDERVAALSRDVEAGPQPATVAALVGAHEHPELTSEIGAHAHAELSERLQELTGRVDSVGQQVGQLAERVDSGAGSVAEDAPAGGGELFDPRVPELAQRVEGLEERAVPDLAQRVEGLEQRAAPEVGPLVERVEALERRSGAEAGGVAGAVVAGELSDALVGRVNGLAGEVGGLAGRVEALERRPGGEAGAAGAAAAVVTAVAADALVGRVEGLAGDVRGLNGRVDGLAGDVGGFQGRVDGLAGEVGGVQGRVDGLGGEVGGLNGRVDGLAGDVNGLGGRVDGLAGDVNGFGGRMDGLAGDVNGLGGRVDGLAGDVGGLAGRVEGSARELGELSGRLEGSAREIGDLYGRLEGSTREVGELAGRVEGLSRDVEALGERGGGQAAMAAVPAAFAAQAVATNGARSVLQLALTEHAGAGWDAHRDGLRLLVRELGYSTHFDGQHLDARRAGDAGQVDVLYLSGHGTLSLSDEEADGIARVLDNGGVVIGEGCAAGPQAEGGAREFAMSFVELANRLGRQLMRVDRGHPIMNARHVFGEPPIGGRASPRVLESGGMVYSDADYGCAWQGGPADKPVPRATIRDAFEFGTNLAVFRRAAPGAG